MEAVTTNRFRLLVDASGFVTGDGVGPDPGAPPEVESLLVVDVSEEYLLTVKAGEGVEAAASVFRPVAAGGKDSAVVAPACVGAGVPRTVALVESPASPAVKACSCSGVELLAVPKTEPAKLWLDFKPSGSSAAAAETLVSADARVGPPAPGSMSTCSVVRLGSEVEVMLLVTGADSLKHFGENNPEIPQSKTRQIFKLHRNIVPKYLKAQINPQLHILMKTEELFLSLGQFIFTLRQKIKAG